MADQNKRKTFGIPSANRQLSPKIDGNDDCILLLSSDDEEPKKNDVDNQLMSENAVVPINNNNKKHLLTTPSECDSGILKKPETEPKKIGPQNLFDAFLSGTPFLRQMVLFESDVILECKSCRNLFRNVNNFLDHKRMYCKDSIRSSSTFNEQVCMAQSQALWENHNRTMFLNEEGAVKHSKRKLIKNENKSVQVNLMGDPNEPHLLLRDIPTTSEAIEQQVVIPRNIMYYDELDRSSAFQHVQLLHDELDTTRLIGEITMRQVRRATLKNIEKRESLHNKLQTANIDFYVESNSPDAESDKASNKKTKGKEKENSPNKKKEKEKKSPESMSLTSISKTLSAENEGNRGVPNKCKFCKKICKNWTALAWHMRIHKRRKYKCPMCHYETPAIYRIKRHVMHVHNKDVKEVDEIVRSVVQKIHQSNSSSSIESSVNDTEPTCDICNKVFSSKRNLVRHKEIHTRSKGKRASGLPTKSDGKSKNERRNTNPEEVEMARRNVFSIVDEKNLQCRKCKKTLSAWRRLVQHCCNHFGYNRYKCKGCPYENGDYTQMRRHMMCKHGRQFRSIQQISEAIRSMKVGVWVNFSLRSERNETTEIASNVDDKKLLKKATEQKTTQKKSNVAAKKVLSESKKSPEPKKSPEQKKSPSEQKTELKKSSEPKKLSEDLAKSLSEIKKEVQENCNSDTVTSEEKRTGVKKTRPEKENASTSTQSSPGKDSPSPVRSSPRISVTPSYVRITPLRNVKDKPEVASKRTVEKIDTEREMRNSLMDRNNLKCLKCNKSFQYISTLRRHVHQHFKKPPETKSGDVERLQFGSKASVYKLINMQDMRCLKCYKRFNDLSSVKRHVERHLGLHSFNCQFCGYISHNFTWFKRHLVLKHSHHIKDEKHLLQLVGQMKGTK